MIKGDFQAPNWLDLQRLHHNLIAQLMAVRRPERVRSLSLFYTAPGLRPYRMSHSKKEAFTEFHTYRSRAEAIELFVQRERVSQSPAFAFDEDWVREWAERSFERCYAPDGVARQAAALSRLPDRIAGSKTWDTLRL